MSYAVEVERLEARLADLDGALTDVRVFLYAAGARPEQPERLSDRLNNPALRFLACERAGQRALVALGWIAYLALEVPPPEVVEAEALGLGGVPVTLELRSGLPLEGLLLGVPRRPADRPSDLLNEGAPRFLLLRRTDGKSVFVNRDAIAWVEFEE